MCSLSGEQNSNVLFHSDQGWHKVWQFFLTIFQIFQKRILTFRIGFGVRLTHLARGEQETAVISQSCTCAETVSLKHTRKLVECYSKLCHSEFKQELKGYFFKSKGQAVQNIQNLQTKSYPCLTFQLLKPLAGFLSCRGRNQSYSNPNMYRSTRVPATSCRHSTDSVLGFSLDPLSSRSEIPSRGATSLPQITILKPS